MNRPSDTSSGAVVRRLPDLGHPRDQAEVLELLRERRLPGIVELSEVRRVQGRVEVTEERFEGLSIGRALAPVHEQISTTVALSLIRDAALALARVHDLDRQRPPIHGRLGLNDINLTRLGEVRVGGFVGARGDPQLDVRALLAALRELLRPKADKPGGASLLARLSALRFASAHELHQTIASHLHRQSSERLALGRERFITSVLSRMGGPRTLPASGGAPPLDPPPGPPEPGFAEAPWSPAASAEVEAAEENTVETDAGAELQEALRSAFAGDDGSFFDPESTDAVADVEADPSLEVGARDSLSESAQTALLEVDLEGLVVAGPFEDAEDPFEDRSRPPPAPVSDPTPALASGPEVAPPPSPLDVEVRAASSVARDGLMAPAAAPEERRASASILVGDYRVVAAIGKGGMGEIYLARSTASRRLVALKVLAATETGEDEALGMLMDEAAIMARIEHPHVLKVLDFGQAEGRYYLATEYLEGRPLVRVMIESYDRDGGMDHAVVAWLGAQSARGLHAAHTATTADGRPLEVVHRDVSPQNIFVTYGGMAKVIDFGVARATERFSRTQIGLVKGKAAYMSPEQAEGRELDARSDVFSLGVCLWEMIAGKRLFKKALDYDTLVAVQTAPIEPPTIVRGRKDPELDQIILAALAREPDARTPSAEALASSLEAYARSRSSASGAHHVEHMMTRLFGEEAEQEQKLIRELEERAPTEEERAALRELSGVSHRSRSNAFTLVGEPDGLGALDDFGQSRRELTGERVIKKVKQLEAKRRSGEHLPPAEPPTPPPATPKIPGRSISATPPPPPRSAPRGRRGWLLAALGLAVLAAVALGLRLRAPSPPVDPDLLPPGTISEPISRAALVRALKRAGARVTPPSGPLQRVEGLGGAPFMLDASSRARRVQADEARGWLLELTPVDGGPAVVWVAQRDGPAVARGLSVNDCPAKARVDAAGVEIRYGSGHSRLPHDGGALRDVVLAAPEGAIRVEVEPLGVSLGAHAPDSELARCPSGWEDGGRVVVRRLPPGRYELTWTGPGVRAIDTLDVRADEHDGP